MSQALFFSSLQLKKRSIKSEEPPGERTRLQRGHVRPACGASVLAPAPSSAALIRLTKVIAAVMRLSR